MAIARGGLPDVFDGLAATELTPPLYYLLAWAWSGLFGIDEAGLRSLSALLGTAAVPVVYLAGCRLVDARAGLAAAALLAVSPLAVHYSQEARSYALLTLLAALTLLFLAEELRRPGDRRALLGWAACAALALATHYFAFFLVAPQAAWLLLRRRDAPGSRPDRGRPATAVLAAVGAVGAVGAALLPLAIHQHGHALLGVIEDVPLSTRAAATFESLAGGPRAGAFGRQPFEMYLWGGALLVAAIGIRRLDLSRRPGAALAFGLAGAAVALPLAAAPVGLDYVVHRNFIVALPALAIAVAAGLASGQRGGVPRMVGAVLLAAIVVASVAAVAQVNRDGALHKADWRGASEALGPEDPRRVLLLDTFGLPTLHAYRDTGELSAATATATELAYVTTGSGDPIRVPAAFSRVERRELDGGLVLIRYRSPRPQRVTRERLLGDRRLDRYGGHVVLDGPRVPADLR